MRHVIPIIAAIAKESVTANTLVPGKNYTYTIFSAKVAF